MSTMIKVAWDCRCTPNTTTGWIDGDNDIIYCNKCDGVITTLDKLKMAHRSMVDTGVDSDQIAEASSSINKRLNELRNHIRELAQTHNFDQALKDSAEEAYKNWHKRSEEEQLKFKE